MFQSFRQHRFNSIVRLRTYTTTEYFDTTSKESHSDRSSEIGLKYRMVRNNLNIKLDKYNIAHRHIVLAIRYLDESERLGGEQCPEKQHIEEQHLDEILSIINKLNQYINE